ncbi:MAG: zinc-dependent metalloprotease [Acidimicrobiales bacterium]
MPSPFGGGGPFDLSALFGDLARQLSSGGALNWDLARQSAQWLATGGEPTANVDPVQRIRLEELARLAELTIGEATGLASLSGTALSLEAVTGPEWASRTIDDWKPHLEALAVALGSGPTALEDVPWGPQGAGLGQDVDPGGGMDLSQLIGGWAKALGPLLLGMQSGSMIGQLASRALGLYDVPVPRPPSGTLSVVAPNLARFSEDWSLSFDDVGLWTCLNEVAHHGVLSTPHVGRRVAELVGRYTGGFAVSSEALEDRLSGMDPSHPESFQEIMGDPTRLLGAVQTPEQLDAQARLSAIVDALEGYVDHVVDRVGQRLVPSYPTLPEALRRRRSERGPGDEMAERLLGFQLTQPHFDRGRAFIAGVLERSGEEALLRLWESEQTLPTPAEVPAPGLWLARIDIDQG